MKFKDTKYGDLSGQTYKGDINVQGMNLTSLEGAPKRVSGFFRCSINPKLITLEGAPKYVGSFFSCSNNLKLVSLKGAPESVGGTFYCSKNPNLISLEGAPKTVGGDFRCYNNPKLTQSEVDKLVKCDIKGKINMPEGLTAPTKEDYVLYKN